MSDIIVRSFDPVALLGAADLAPSIVNILQRHSAIFVAADGGVRHLAASGIMPAAIIGDMDSVSAEMRKIYADVMHISDDQNTTDFQKSVMCIDAPLIFAAGFLGGRLDHTVSVLNTMARDNILHVVLVSEDDVCFLARPSKTELSLPVGTRVGLLPLANARVETQGLRWDIKDAAMSFDGFISTSNETEQENVTIHAMGRLLINLPIAALDAAIAAVRVR
jgi:thiamine pyrophosphokinase